MNTIRFGLLAALLLCILPACQNFLDREPLGVETDQNFFNDETNAILAVNSIYDAASWDEGPAPNGGYTPHNYEFMFGDILSDDAAKGSEPSDFTDLIEMEQWRTTPNNGPIRGVWFNMYTGLFRANTVIKNLPEADIDPALKNRLIGEAKFMRGYFYFYLARVFGGMPLFEEPVTPSQFGQVRRASIQETYAFIDRNFQEAIELLPEKGAYGAADLGRASKGAARAFLARSIMYQVGLGMNGRSWQDVYNLTNAVIQSGEYSLLANYAQLFEEEGENSVESIFEIQMTETSINWGPRKVGTTNNIFQNNRNTWGWGFNNPTQSLYDEFESGDPRLPCTIYKNGDIVLGVPQEIDFPAENETGYLNRKAAVIKPVETKSAGQNIRKFRYADILLMQAEAAYHLGNESEARQRLNQIRDRARQASKPKGSAAENDLSYPAYPAGSNDNVLPPVGNNVSGQALLDAIYHERRVELGMESLRFWDTVRTGRYLNTLDPAYRSNVLSRSISGLTHPYPVLPLPVEEVQTWGLEQNPGY